MPQLRHTTVTITPVFMRTLNPCNHGFDAVAPLLPAKLSTDPDENYDLACELVEGGRPHDLIWLCDRLGVNANHIPSFWTGDAFYPPAADAMFYAQRLAIIADVLAVRRGR